MSHLLSWVVDYSISPSERYLLVVLLD